MAISAGSLGLFLALVYFGGAYPLPPDRVLKIETSPDGSQTATYSWRPCGLVRAVTKVNPWVYLTIRDRASGKVTKRYCFWGDIPEDAETRLVKRKPW